jgi:hypothetical protein
MQNKKEKKCAFVVRAGYERALDESWGRGGAPYVAYGYDSEQTPYDARTEKRIQHRTAPYDTVRHRTIVKHRAAP